MTVSLALVVWKPFHSICTCMHHLVSISVEEILLGIRLYNCVCKLFNIIAASLRSAFSFSTLLVGLYCCTVLVVIMVGFRDSISLNT